MIMNMGMKELDDVEVYKSALQLAQKIYKLTKSENIKRDFSLVDQMKRASLSVAANIAEGFGRKSNQDFAHFLSISLGSANETIAYLDFIALEYRLSAADIKADYQLLAKRIFAFRMYLTTNHKLRTTNRS